MSRSWTRSAVSTLCGGPCCREIRVGAPVQVIEVPGLTAKKVRCVQCAIGEPPPDLPPLVEQPPIQPSPLVRAGKVKLPFDFKRAAVREPGEEG